MFFESYKILKQFEKNNFFPSNPKFIFTSNSYDTDEVFKIWVAKKTEENFKYFVGQHGNNAGQHFCWAIQVGLKRYTTNRFISWGWDDKRKNTLKGFNFKKSIDLKIKKEGKNFID